MTNKCMEKIAVINHSYNISLISYTINGASVPTSSGAGAMVSQAWGGARSKTTRTRPPLNYEASTSSSSSARLRNSESDKIRVLPACDPNVSDLTNNNDLQSKEAAESVECEQQPPVSVPDLLPRPPVTASPTHAASAPVLSPSEETVTIMPRSKSLNSSLGECAMSAPERQVRLDNPRLLAIREALLFSGREEPEARTLETGQDSPDLASALQRLTLPSLPLIPPVSVLPSQKAMIWTEKEAVRKQVSK